MQDSLLGVCLTPLYLKKGEKMGIYQNLYNIIQTYIYGGIEITPNIDLVCTLVATIGSVFVVSIPFMVVWFVIRLITGGWK